MLTRLVRRLAPALILAALPVASFAGVAIGVSINIAPPVLPVYVQPAPPAADYIWTPGYWAWGGDDGYYWVPGTWVLAPQPGLLWTPGYWGWAGGAYLWHGGYWGPHVGFYGGVNYGWGYGGVGFEGGYWRGGHVVYNRAVSNVTNINVTNVYSKTVVVNNVSHVSFNGGQGGIVAHASAEQLSAEHEHHFDPTPMQRQHIDMAAKNTDLRASVNHGMPHIAATERPASFSGRGVVAARAAGGEFHPAVHQTGPHPGEALHGQAIHDEGVHTPAVHNEAPHNPAVHNEVAHNNFAHQPPQEHSQPHASGQPMARVEHAGGGQPHPSAPNAGPPHGQGPHPGGGGRPEGREGHEGHGQQNRFR
jgi:hypothetical protein